MQKMKRYFVQYNEGGDGEYFDAVNDRAAKRYAFQNFIPYWGDKRKAVKTYTLSQLKSGSESSKDAKPLYVRKFDKKLKGSRWYPVKKSAKRVA